MNVVAADSHYRDRFREMIRSLTGINLAPGKVRMIDQRLRQRVVAYGLADTETYLERLLTRALPAQELSTVIDLITTNTTSFFREPDHFDFLAEVVVPRVARRSVAGRPAQLKLWSAAASEGAEAYTAAIALQEARQRGHVFDFAILGTDLSQRMLDRARSAVYEAEQLATVRPDLQHRYFMHASEPALAGKVRIVPELRRRVQFRHLNLVDSTYPVDRDVDVILLRNVLIYFDIAIKEEVVARMADHLRPGGLLIVGHAESMVVRSLSLRQVKPTIFQKI
jgi:chemotaxis protein methyltransferase CheR